MRISQWKIKAIVTVGYLGIVALFCILGISCIYKSAFGVCCPGCGMTRAMLAALRLDLRAAFSYHPMFWSMPILYLYFWLDKGIFPKKIWNVILLSAIGIGFFVNWLCNLW